MFSDIKTRSCVISLLSSAFLAFGLYHVHSFSGVTEGGILGITLLLQHWFRLSPAVSGLLMNLVCYSVGSKFLGKKFVIYSLVATAGFSLSYKICEQFGPLWPQLGEMPLLASVVGALFVGIGAGLCVRIGGAPSGDDALAMSLSHLTKIKIQWIYFISDLVVLTLSVSYIPLQRLGYSLLTVILSGQIVGLIQQVPFPWKGTANLYTPKSNAEMTTEIQHAQKQCSPYENNEDVIEIQHFITKLRQPHRGLTFNRADFERSVSQMGSITDDETKNHFSLALTDKEGAAFPKSQEKN